MLTAKVASAVPYLTLLAKGMTTVLELPALDTQLHRLFFGAFHHQHRIEGSFAAMRRLDNGHLLAENLQARTGMAANVVAPSAAATMATEHRTSLGAKGALEGKPLARGVQSKAQAKLHIETLLEFARAVEQHRRSFSGGPLPAAPPCGDIVKEFELKHEQQSTAQRTAKGKRTRGAHVAAEPEMTKKARIVSHKEATAGVTNTWAANVTCACCHLLLKPIPRPAGAKGKPPTEKARPCDGRCGHGFHESCWGALRSEGGQAPTPLPTGCWSCWDLDRQFLPWASVCVSHEAC